MKNFKLSTKLTILTFILCLCLALTAYVGWFRLSKLNDNTVQLGSKTFAHVMATGDLRTQLFLMIRNQKNAVISTDDNQTAHFADTSEDHGKEMVRLAAQLNADLALTPLRSNAERAVSTVELLAASNKQCLDEARLNTIVKANQLLSSKILPTLGRLALVIEKSLELPKASEEGIANRNLEEWCKLLVLSNELGNSLVTHVGTPVSDKVNFERADTTAKQKREAFLTAARLCKSPELESTLTEINLHLGEEIDKFISLSTADSNNKSIELSLSKSKEQTDNALAALDILMKALRDEASKGVKESSVIYFDSSLFLLGTSILGLVLGTCASIFISRSVTGPVSLVKDLAQRMADGDLMSRIQLNQKDEVGELATATDALADALSGVVCQIQKTSENLTTSSRGLGKIANGLASQSEQTSSRASSVSSASEQLSTNISTMSSAAEEMSMNFASISSATEEMSVSVGSISSAAEQTSSNVAAVASAIHDISTSFEHILGNVRDGARVANNASQMADSANSTMKHLDQSSTEISKVTETIKMIALQTNLLALNATIEATSAGEAGKGFAVVAHEIKQLANQSAKAAEDIAIKIEGVQNGTRQAVGVIHDIAHVIKEINGLSDRISTSVEQQSRAAQTISQNIGQASSGVNQIARSISEVAATANDMSRNIAEATRGATDVSRNVSEAAKAASAISDSITQVSKAAQETNRSSTGITTASQTLADLSQELTKLASRFRIPADAS